jgi:hypothetical protein
VPTPVDVALPTGRTAELGADLMCLGMSGQRHLDPMVAGIIRDRPGDVIVTCLGINVHGNGSYNSSVAAPRERDRWRRPSPSRTAEN